MNILINYHLDTVGGFLFEKMKELKIRRGIFEDMKIAIGCSRTFAEKKDLPYHMFRRY